MRIDYITGALAASQLWTGQLFVKEVSAAKENSGKTEAGAQAGQNINNVNAAYNLKRGYQNEYIGAFVRNNQLLGDNFAKAAGA